MKKNGWFFGCSFTSGFGLNFDNDLKILQTLYPTANPPFTEIEWNKFPYSKFESYKTKYENNIWPKLICEHYDLEYNNHGISGASNDEILHSVITQLSNIKSGDYVFIGNTTPIRILVPLGSKFKPLTSTSSIGENGVLITKHEDDDDFFYNDKQKEIIVDYLNEIVLNKEEFYEIHYTNLFENLKIYFINNGVNCVFWKWREWFNYETIKEWTNGKIDDTHWSPKGHLDFSKKIITLNN
jgi:hypothetical protein